MPSHQLKPDLLIQKVHDELVILDPASGEYFTLNEVAACMAEALQQGASELDIVQAVTSRYEVETQEVKRDLQQLLEQLEQHKLLIPLAC